MAGESPRTSALTVWSVAARAVTVPRATTEEKAASAAISQPTSVSGPAPEPGCASSVGVTRVHSRTPSGSGSPEATPCRNWGVAAAVAVVARDSGGPDIFGQVLLYPGVDRDMAAHSIVSQPDAPLLAHDDILYMHELADRGAGDPHDIRRVPAYAADLRGLPQAIVVTAQLDPISDWGERYAHRLRDAGVQTTLTRYPGIYHGFLMRSETTARGRLAMAETGALLRAKFANPLRF